MKKTIITLLALAGVAAADTQYFDFGNMAANDAINITASGATGNLTAMRGSYTFTSDKTITLSQTTTDKNEWCDPFTGTIPSIFTGDSYVDGLTTQATSGSTGVLTLTLSGLENGVYSLDVFGGFVGKDNLAAMSITVTAGGSSVEWAEIKSTNTNGEWISGDYPIENGKVTINSIDSDNADSETNQSQNPTITKGYQATATNIEVTDGSLTLKIEGQGWNNSYARTAVNGVALHMIPEPATATLSLLALCGLAARRRRK